MQLDLLSDVQAFYEENLDSGIDNQTLYKKIESKIKESNDSYIKPVGRSGTLRNVLHRKIRWAQQTLKTKGLLKRAGPGVWEVSGTRKNTLHAIKQSKSMLAMSTRLGIAIWGDSETVFKDVLQEEVHLCVTSPPYPLRIQRAYGGVGVDEYSDFICRIIEPIVSRLAEGGNIVLNVSNDIFEEGSPARSLYVQYLMVDLNRKLGLHFMDDLIWGSNKSPGPVLYASKSRQQLNYSYEHLLWFTNNPIKCIADNSRVRHLFETKKTHQKFVENGGQKKHCTSSGDGAHKKHVNGFKNVNGKIPGNYLYFSNYCKSGRKTIQYARELGLPAHGAKMPRSVCDFLVQFLSRKGDLVVDPFGGTFTLGESAEIHDRRWVVVEKMWEYIRQSFVRFDNNDILLNPLFMKSGGAHLIQ